jgi:hypothetical protein
MLLAMLNLFSEEEKRGVKECSWAGPEREGYLEESSLEVVVVYGSEGWVGRGSLRE